jgi:Ca2+-binding RTX toxin-like protein
VNYGAVETLTFSGGADDDVLVNNGEVTTLTFSGGADDDTLQNNDVVAVLTFSGGADDDVFIANADNVGAMVFNGDDGADSLINNGDSFASLTFNGGAGADVLRGAWQRAGECGRSTGGSDAAADTFNYSGTAASGSGVTFAGGPGNDLLAWRGSADTLSFTGGAGDDSCIIVGSGVLSLDGGDGNDTVYFQADLQATVTVVEGYGGSGDTSSDTLNFSSYTGAALNLDLRSTSAQAQSARFSLTLSNGLGLENVVGTSGADTIYGNCAGQPDLWC